MMIEVESKKYWYRFLSKMQCDYLDSDKKINKETLKL